MSEVSIEPIHADIPANFSRSTLQTKVLGYVQSIYLFERMAYNQCCLTALASVDIKGKVSQIAADSSISWAAEAIEVAYERFERGDEVDKTERKDFINSMRLAPRISEEERSLALKSLSFADVNFRGEIIKSEYFSVKEGNNGFSALPWKRFASSQDMYDHNMKKYTKYVEGQKSAWIKATTNVDCSAEEALAWVWFSCR